MQSEMNKDRMMTCIESCYDLSLTSFYLKIILLCRKELDLSWI